MLGHMLIDHQHVYQIFIQSSVQILHADWTKKVDSFTLFKVKPGMFDA
jgi:hypothetical protein